MADDLTDQEYEELYREAVGITEDRFGVSGFIRFDSGKRCCVLSDFGFNDSEIFTLAWGVAAASRIEAERDAYNRSIRKIA